MAKAKRKAVAVEDGQNKAAKTSDTAKPGKKQQEQPKQQQEQQLQQQQQNSNFKNKEKVLILSTRGVTFR
jgi:hypothetical protein